MEIECPVCEKEIDVTDRMPGCASDTNTIECECGAEIEVGWYSTAEARDWKTADEIGQEEKAATAAGEKI